MILILDMDSQKPGLCLECLGRIELTPELLEILLARTPYPGRCVNCSGPVGVLGPMEE